MKFATKKFPKGTFKRQKSDGVYIEPDLAGNLNVFARKIAKDMHFLLLITGNDSVGNGKTTLATHVGAYLTNAINHMHEKDNTFTSRNMVFNTDDLQTRSFELPKYSVIVLDEGDDLTAHSMKQTTQELKRYFRKCRQLNQILILILPSFFELPKFFALARSHGLINVQFMGEFERGYAKFYSPKSKKKLYIYGKREWDYSCVKCDFDIRFHDGYAFFPNAKEEAGKYLEDKHKDIEEEAKPDKKLSAQKLETWKLRLKMINLKFPIETKKEFAEKLGVMPDTLTKWKERAPQEVYRDRIGVE